MALSRTEAASAQWTQTFQPGLSIKPGRNAAMTHDYKRNGTSTLFAALNVLTGEVLGQCAKRHHHIEWLKLLRFIDKSTPAGKEIHIICDNYATHEHPNVKKWLGRHKRFHVHFTPTSVSWLNMAERFFRDLSEQQLRRGVFGSVAELEKAVMTYVEKHNKSPAPFIWTKSANDILEKVKRGRQTLNKLQSV